VNNKDSSGQTALMCAVRKSHNSIVKLLLDHPGVKVNEKNKWGSTALHYAAYFNNPEGASLLLLHPSISATATTDVGQTALHYAAIGNNPAVARLLLLHPSFNSANATTNGGETPLMVAVRNCKKEVLVELVKHDSVSLDIPDGYFDGSYADLLQIIDEARTRRTQVSNLAADIQRGTSRSSRGSNQGRASRLSTALRSTLSLNDDGSNQAANNQGGASRSRALGSTISLNDDDSNQGGASRLSIALGSTLSLNDDVVIIVKTLKLIMRNGIGEPISTKFKTKLRAFTFTGI